MGEIYTRYKTVQLPEKMLLEIKDVIARRPELGYHSVKGFVEDCVRRRLEDIAKAPDDYLKREGQQVEND